MVCVPPFPGSVIVWVTVTTDGRAEVEEAGGELEVADGLVLFPIALATKVAIFEPGLIAKTIPC